MLLAAYNARRPTRDIDLLATALSNDLTIALAAIRDIASIDIADGLRYDTDAATAQTIRDDDEYTGIRVTITTRLATAVLPIHIDINVGDPVAPPAEPIALPRLRGGTPTGYPIAMVTPKKSSPQSNAAPSTPAGATSPTSTCSAPDNPSTAPTYNKPSPPSRPPAKRHCCR